MREIIGQAEALDTMAEHLATLKDAAMFRPLGALALDLKEMCKSLPLSEMPEPDLIRHLALLRQAATTYQGFASVANEERIGTEQWARLKGFAVGSHATIAAARKACDHAIARLDALTPPGAGSGLPVQPPCSPKTSS